MMESWYEDVYHGKFKHGVPKQIATYDEGGQYVGKVFETRMPARFYDVQIFRWNEKVLDLDTESGREMGELAHKIADAFAKDMLRINDGPA